LAILDALKNEMLAQHEAMRQLEMSETGAMILGGGCLKVALPTSTIFGPNF
jgi:hypothetical protein